MNTQPNKQHRVRLWVYGLLTLGIMVFIFVMSAEDGTESGALSDSFLASLIGQVLVWLLPANAGITPELAIRKGAHMLEYFCLSIPSLLYLRERFDALRGRWLSGGASALFFCFVYACTDEWHQTFVPERAGRFTDVMIDTAGALIGVLLTAACVALHEKRKRRNS